MKSEASVSTITGVSGSKYRRRGAVMKAETSYFSVFSIVGVLCQSFAHKEVLLVMGRMILL